MALANLTITNLRRIASADVELSPGVNLFQGANAQGKTTVLEAVALISRGRSFRASRDRECIRTMTKPEEFAAVDGEFERHGSSHRIRLALEKNRKSVWLDGKPLGALSELWGRLPTVVFVPSDLQILQGPPQNRRDFLDTLVCQSDPGILPHLNGLNRALQQRNRLLRERVSTRNAQYDGFEEALANHSHAVMKARVAVALEIAEMANQPLSQLTGDQEDLRVELDQGFREKTPTASDSLREFWAAARQGDMERGTTRQGPHRADLTVRINGTDIRTYGSQGQTRSAVLALRLAEAELLEKRTGERPLLLLDDILGELDTSRAEGFLALLCEHPLQSLITATDAALVRNQLSPEACFNVRDGEVVRKPTP